MKKEIVQLVFGVIILIAWFFVQDTSVKDFLFKSGSGYFFATGIAVVVFIWDDWKKITLVFQAYGIKRKQPIRISMAYLFRITVHGKFLLIRNHRDQVGFQPVGGVYKYLKNETQELFNDLGIESCHSMPVDKESKDDLRINMSHRKNIIGFLKWFESRRNRETDPWREFQEELIADEILPVELFPYIQYNFSHKRRTKIQKSEKFPTDEFLHADIYELKCSTTQQQDVLEKLLNSQSDRYVFATPEEIRKGHTNNGKVIIAHSKKLLNDQGK